MTRKVTNKNKIERMLEDGFDHETIARTLKVGVRYVHSVARGERGTKWRPPSEPKVDMTRLTYATPRPCGPLEEFAWKYREREAKRRELAGLIVHGDDIGV